MTVLNHFGINRPHVNYILDLDIHQVNQIVRYLLLHALLTEPIIRSPVARSVGALGVISHRHTNPGPHLTSHPRRSLAPVLWTPPAIVAARYTPSTAAIHDPVEPGRPLGVTSMFVGEPVAHPAP